MDMSHRIGRRTRPVAATFGLMALGLMAVVLAASGGLARAEAPAPLASEWVTVAGSKVRLIAGGGMAGVEMQLEDGWKTYWRNPGEAGGVPPAFDWTGSGNLKSQTVLYPAPKRLVDKGSVNIGYKGHVVFPVRLDAADPGKPVALKLTFAYGICKDICVPAEAVLALDIPAGAAPLPALAETLAHVPVGADMLVSSRLPRLETIEAVYAGEKPRIVLKTQFGLGATHQDAFAEGPDGVYLPLPVLKGEIAAEGRAGYEIDLSDGIDVAALKGKTLTVTLVSDKGNTEQTFTIPP